ncbi:MAG: 2-dehydropantoate 2-reductase [Elusimicrobia bacterium]|nr:2-dehydropantoate 2-reductase [Elusimicrobiota bacterium]
MLPIGIVGPGAIGGLLSSQFVRAGYPVVLVGRDEDWLRRVRREGLRILGKEFGDRRVRPGKKLRVTLAPSGPPCAAVFICVKSADTAGALKTAAPLIGPSTAIIGLQNGLAHPGLYRRAFGERRTIFGASLIASERPNRLTMRHHGGREILLSRHAGNETCLRVASRLLARSGWKTRALASRDHLLWTKAAFNAAVNPLGALTGRTNGELARIPALREVLLRLLRETTTLARRDGRAPLRFSRLKSQILHGCRAAPGQPNSMLQDVRAGRRTEVDAIVAPFLRIARRRGIPAPTLESIHRFVKRLERELRRKT